MEKNTLFQTVLTYVLKNIQVILLIMSKSGLLTVTATRKLLFLNALE